MTTAIIGTGNMASGLARRLVRPGLDVALGSRDPAKARALAGELGSRAQGSDIAVAVQRAEIVMLAVPYDAVAEVLAGAGKLAGKVLVDITNPITPDYMALTIGHTTSAAKEIQSSHRTLSRRRRSTRSSPRSSTPTNWRGRRPRS